MRLSAPLSATFRADVVHFDSTRRFHYQLSDRALAQLTAYLESAIAAGRLRSLQPGFLSAVLRQIAYLIDDPSTLERLGITHEQALADTEVLVWEGLAPRSTYDPADRDRRRLSYRRRNSSK